MIEVGDTGYVRVNKSYTSETDKIINRKVKVNNTDLGGELLTVEFIFSFTNDEVYSSHLQGDTLDIQKQKFCLIEKVYSDDSHSDLSICFGKYYNKSTDSYVYGIFLDNSVHTFVISSNSVYLFMDSVNMSEPSPSRITADDSCIICKENCLEHPMTKNFLIAPMNSPEISNLPIHTECYNNIQPFIQTIVSENSKKILGSTLS